MENGRDGGRCMYMRALPTCPGRCDSPADTPGGRDLVQRLRAVHSSGLPGRAGLPCRIPKQEHSDMQTVLSAVTSGGFRAGDPSWASNDVRLGFR